MTTNDDGPVALFTGATAGLGEAILKAYAKKHKNSRIYFVGRNDAAALQIKEDVQRMWNETPQHTGDKGDIIFVKADLTLLTNIHGVFEEILKREGTNARLDFLCMSQGFLTLKGRMETTEHHDAPLMLQFYSRAYLAYLFLPYLRRSNATNGARVISVHAPGHEGPLYLEDLELKKRHPSALDWIFPAWLRRLTGLDPGYLKARISHSVIMTTFFFEQLVQREREESTDAQPSTSTRHGTEDNKTGVSFLHVFPGLVKTKEFEKGDFPSVLKFFFMKIMLPLLTPFTVKLEKVGESITLMAEDPKFRYIKTAELRDAEESEFGSDGIVESGSYCLNWNGTRILNDKKLRTLREKGAVKAVWDHCMNLFNGVSNTTGA